MKVIKIITIELVEEATLETNWNNWKVTYEDKYADGLTYDELLGLLAAITMPENRPTLQWLKTKEQHKAWRDHLDNIANKNK